jgi:nitrate reductase NapE component
MTTPELFEHHPQFAVGMTRDAIRETLVKQGGWNPGDAEEGIRLVEAALSPTTSGTLPPATPSLASGDVVIPTGATERDMKAKSGRARTFVIVLLVVAVLAVGVAGAFAYILLSEKSPQFKLSRPGESNGIISESLEVSQKKTRNSKRISDLRNVQLALELYYDANRQYPNTLDAVVPMYLPWIPESPDGAAGTYIHYTPLSSENTPCSGESKCTGYHIGVSLEDADTFVLGLDADFTSANVDGKDSSGCSGEIGRACYDLVP